MVDLSSKCFETSQHEKYLPTSSTEYISSFICLPTEHRGPNSEDPRNSKAFQPAEKWLRLPGF